MKSAKIFMYDRYAGILKKMKPASSANEVSFKCQRSLLHLPSRLYSFFSLFSHIIFPFHRKYEK